MAASDSVSFTTIVSDYLGHVHYSYVRSSINYTALIFVAINVVLRAATARVYAAVNGVSSSHRDAGHFNCGLIQRDLTDSNFRVDSLTVL